MQQIPEAILEAIESINMPSIPHILLRFLSRAEDDRASMAELATLVGQDPALSARFFTIANSAALRRDAEIKSLDRCMVALGTRLARTLASCLAIQRVFSGAADDMKYNFAGFWGHSLQVAELSREIAVRKNYPHVEEAYLAGLLHDVGQLLLLGGVGERYGELLRLSIIETVLCDVEEPILGTDHAVIGAWLVDKWKLSSFMSDAVLFHHKPADEIVAADPLSQIVWSSHIISSYDEKIEFVQIAHLPEITSLKSMLGLDLSELGSIHSQSSARVASIAAALGIAEYADARTLPWFNGSHENLHLRMNDIDPAHSRLEAVVRDMAIMQSLQHKMSSLGSEAEALLAVRESARILFGLDRLAFLLVQPCKSLLSGANFKGQPAMLQQLRIKLDPVQSLAAAVALGEIPCSTFDEQRPSEASLVDTQVARALNSEGLLYIPMRTGNGCIGVMTYGVSAAQFARIRNRLDWMTSFAHIAAISIESCHEMREHGQNLEATLASSFEKHARQVVHEAGNPLGIIKNYLMIVRQKLPEENGVRQELDILREEIDRVSHILRRLNDMTEVAPSSDSLDINSLIEVMLALYGESLFSSRGITVEKSMASPLSPVMGERDSVKQILLNLWKNAAEAMPDGGSIAISTRDNVIQGGRSHSEIRLSDSGPGLPEEVLERLFQPLDPNRRPGHSGIGLSIVAALVERLNGQITCQSNSGHGTSFSILLPRFVTDAK